MATQADQSHISDFPLPSSSNQNPTRGDFPRKLIVLDGDWEPSTDPTILAGMDYLAVSYRQNDFPNKTLLKKMVKRVCIKLGILAYWIDFACTGETPEEKNQDLYRIADVFRNAKMTLIVIKGEDDRPLSDGWVSWGMRIWTFPEALLSENFIVQVGLGKLLIKEMTLNQVANHAYGSDNERQRMLIQLYSNKGKDFSEIPERFEMLCEAIWGRHSSPDSSEARSSSALTAYPGEKVYALMGFLLHRILPRSTESEDEAFERLLDENSLQCDRYPRIAYGSGGTHKLGIRIKKDMLAKEVDDADLPKHVAEAKFDYGKTVRTICEEGTREEILDEVYSWLGLGSNSAVSHTNDNLILWLNGLAGSGKSTIAQTAARRCDDEYILGGTFFCSRYTKECSDLLNIFATIAYELGRFNSDFKHKLSEIYSNKKDLQRAQPERQLQKLIVEPLRTVLNMQRCVVIIDALDECSDDNARSVILEALDKHRDELAPLKFLITSRPEQNIKGAFLTLNLSNDTQNFDLNKVDPEQTRRDIRAFLVNRLTNLAIPRGLKMWPSKEDIDALVELANGLFIFASTTVKFLSDKNAISLKDQLETLLTSKVPVSESPYKHLDFLYLQVFTTAFDEISDKLRFRLQTVLGSLVLSQRLFSITSLGDLLEMSTEDIRETLRNLHSLVVVPENDDESIRLIHPSIHDFLTDKNRCNDSRFVVNKAAGHSTIVRCCFRKLVKFAESEEMRPFLQAPTRRKLNLLKESIERNDHSAIKYSYDYWNIHLEDSDLNEDMMKDLEGLVSNQNKYLLARYSVEAAEALLWCIRKLPKESLLSSDLPSMLYQSAVFLLGEIWPLSPLTLKDKLWNALETLHTECGYKNGLFGLNERTVDLEVAIVSLQNFVPKEDVPKMDAIIHQLKRAAEEIHKNLLQQTIPEGEKLHLDLMALMSKLYGQLSKAAYENRNLNGDSDDYAKRLEVYLFVMLYPMEAFNEIFDCFLNNNLDNFLTEKLVTAFSTADDMQLNVLRAILTVSLLHPGILSFADTEGLQSLFHLPTDQIYTKLFAKLIFVGVLVNDIAQIKLLHSTLFSTFFDSAKCLDICFFVDPIVEHSKIALRSVEKLLQFISLPKMQSYQSNPSQERRSTLTNNLRKGNDTALTYAYQYWIFHIDKSDQQLDEQVLQLLGELVSNLRAFDVIVRDDDKVISVFLSLFNKLSHRPSLPSNIMKQLYKAAIFLCSNNWPVVIKDIKKQRLESIKEARGTLKTNFSYKDGLYDLDPNFPLLSIAIFKFSNFLPYRDIPKLENNIHELRNCANVVHELIMQQAVPEDEGVHSVLQEYMSTLYKELKSRYWTYKKANWHGNGAYKHALRHALLTWITSLKNFQTHVHDILGIPDNIESSEVPNPAIIAASEQNGPEMTATVLELSSEDDNDVAHASVSDAAKRATTSVASPRPFAPLLTLPPTLLNESISRDNAAEVGSHEATIAHTAPIDALVAAGASRLGISRLMVRITPLSALVMQGHR